MEKEVKIKNFPNLRTVYLTGEINADALQQFKKDLDLLIEADNEIFNDNVRSLADVNPELSKAYKEHVKFPPLVLDITSPGGSAYIALALYDIIRNYNLNSNHKIIARATGLIASAATIIILACDERECGKNSTFMIHSISTYNAGKLQDIEDDIKETVRLSEAIKNIYTERTNITLKKLKEVDKLKQDWFMTADEALDVGLVTKIF